MYPVCKCTEPFPQPISHHKNHIPHSPYYIPGLETIPPTSETPVTFRPSPCHSSFFYYPNPTECQNCCSHSYPPGYYGYRPPHPYPLHYPPPYVYGPYPQHDAYSPYPMPPYHLAEYDKNKAKDHCCGCPNHTCTGKADNKVRIEEERSEPEGKGDDSSHGLNKLQNHSYPIICMPPGYMRDKEIAKHPGFDSMIRNGQFPLDLNGGTGSFSNCGDEKRIKDLHSEDKKPQVQWPIIWFPGYDKPEEVEKKDLKDVKAGPRVTKDAPTFKIIPVKALENEKCEQKPMVAEVTGNGSSAAAAEKFIKPEVSSSAVVEKCVKPESSALEDDKSKGDVIEKDNKVKKIEVKHGGKKGEKNSKTSLKTKLPPVCLRVDPLPKKKSGNGNSRSQSPPSAKGREYQVSRTQEPDPDEVKKNRQSKNEEANIINENKVPLCDNDFKKRQPKIREINVIDVGKLPHTAEPCVGSTRDKDMDTKIEKILDFADKSKQNVSTEARNEDHTQCLNQVRNEDDIHSRQYGHKNVAEAGSETEKVIDVQNNELNQDEKAAVEEKVKREGNEANKTLTDVEAAVIIQSAYRGYEVRKWEPLKKLRQIVKIRQQANDMREQIQDFESSTWLKHDEKKRLMFNETIMNLLLQLDTIQGLHPGLREIRKSVARELVCLQEKLDSLTSPTGNVPLIEQKTCQTVDEQNQKQEVPIQRNDSGEVEEQCLKERLDLLPNLNQGADGASQPNESGEVEDQFPHERLDSLPNLVSIEQRTRQDADELNQGTDGASQINESGEVEKQCLHERLDSLPNLVSIEQKTCQDADEQNQGAEGASQPNEPGEGNLIPTEQRNSQPNEPEEREKENDSLRKEVASEKKIFNQAASTECCNMDMKNENANVAGPEEPDSKKANAVEHGEVKLPIIEEPFEVSPPQVKEEESAAMEVQQSPSSQDDHLEEATKSQEVERSRPKSPHSSGDFIDSMPGEDMLEDRKPSEKEGDRLNFITVTEDEFEAPKLLPQAMQEKDVEFVSTEEEESCDATNQHLPIEAPEGDDECMLLSPGIDAGFAAAELTDERQVQDVCKGVESSDTDGHNQTEYEVERNLDPKNVCRIPQQEAELKSGVATEVNSILDTDGRIACVEAGPKNDSPVVIELTQAEGEPQPPSKPGSGVGNADHTIPSTKIEMGNDRLKLDGENEKLKEMVDKLVEAGKQQLAVISELNGRVRSLEKKLGKTRKLKVRRHRAINNNAECLASASAA